MCAFQKSAVHWFIVYQKTHSGLVEKYYFILLSKIFSRHALIAVDS
jgi:hypothetical protein